MQLPAPMKHYIITLCFILSLLTTHSQFIRYVTQSGAGTKTGLSWANAADSSQVQLMMNQLAPSGGQLWIAAGTYLPTAPPPGCNNCTGIVRRYTFTLKESVNVYGGFAGGETLLSQANPALNKTIWSGNCGSLTDSTDNSVHIAVATAVFDGVIVSGITFSGAYAGNIGNISLANDGGGLAVVSGKVELQDCVFENNVALGYGSAVVSQTGSLKMRRCLIQNNKQLNGAVAGTTYGTFYIDSCRFLNNTTYGDTGLGGALYTKDASLINDCVFEGNSVRNGKGGALFVANTVSYIKRCVFANNTASQGGGIATMTAVNTGEVKITMHNSVFYSNTAAKGGAIAANSDADVEGYNLTVYGNVADSGSWCYSTGYGSGRFYNSIGAGNIGTEKAGPGILGNNLLQYTLFNNVLGTPSFTDAANPKGADGVWMTADDGLMLECGSPGQDLVTSLTDTNSLDITGISRPQGEYKDMGAYEKIPTGIYPAIDSIVQLGIICSGGTGNFSVAFTNAGSNYTYAWKVNNSSVNGNQNTLTATIPYNVPVTYSLTSPDYCAGSHTVSTTRLASMLVTVTPVAYISVPNNATVCDTDVTLRFTAGLVNNVNPIAYKWYNNGMPVGTDTSVYYALGYQFGDSIYCVITTDRPCVTTATVFSNKIGIRQRTLPVFDTIADVATMSGNSAAFVARLLTNNGPYTYRWQVNNGNGFTDAGSGVITYVTSTLTIPVATQNMDGYTYRCIVVDTCGHTDTTNIGTLHIISSLIVIPPVDTIGCGLVSIAVVTNNSCPDMEYKWERQVNGVFSGNQLSFNYSPTYQAACNYYYRCIVSCEGGNRDTTEPVYVQCQPTIYIAQEPASLIVCQGQTARFAIAATGYNNTYQWRTDFGNLFVDGVDSNGQIISGSTTDTLTIRNAQPLSTTDNEMLVYCRITDGCERSIVHNAKTMMVNDSMLVEFFLAPSICLQQNVLPLNGGIPYGGSYSGPGVSNSNFYPGTAGIGQHTLTYSYNTHNSCTMNIEKVIEVTACSGIEDNDNKPDVVVYPNPANQYLTIATSRAGYSISVYNTSGSLLSNSIMNSTTTTLDIENLVSGVYFIELSGNGHTTRKKFVKL